MKLSIVICTYDRVKLTKSLLDNLLKLSSFDLIHELILVDNHNEQKTIKALENHSPKLKAIHESKTGLSFARNTGMNLASGDWLIYLDDDILANDFFIPEIVKTIKEFDFVMFTGVWKAWHNSTPPRWLPYDTGNYILKGKNQIREIGKDNVTGLIMIIKKSVLKEVGGFPTHLGMTGNKVAYGEESYVEQEVKKRGYKVGINPNIVIEHLVGKHKYKLNWHIEAAYAKGRDAQYIRPISKGSAILQLIQRSLLGWIKPTAKLFVRKKYYWQNWWIDYIGGIMNSLGRLRA